MLLGPAFPQYTWVLVTGALFAFVASYGMGGNDVSNSFGTSVGAKSVTMCQAIVIASIFELLGAILLGSHVTNTISNGLIDFKIYEKQPELLMFGMMVVIIACAFWLVVATFWALPVSSTHTCIGGIVGIALATKGPKAIKWSEITKVFLSWIVSPFLSGIVCYIMYIITRKHILKHQNGLKRAVNLMPYLLAVVISVNVFLVLGDEVELFAKRVKREYVMYLIIGISIVFGIIVGLITHFGFSKKIMARANACSADEFVLTPHETTPLLGEQTLDTVLNMEQTMNTNSIHSEVSKTTGTSSPLAPVDQVHSLEPTLSLRSPTTPMSARTPVGEMSKKKSEMLTQDVHAALQDKDSIVAKMHEKAEKYPAPIEKVFAYLQVVSATCNSFAHGANDVSHTIGPFVTIYEIYTFGKTSGASPPFLILLVGAIGIVLGLATVGYKVIATVGVNLAAVTPSRGFFIEFSSFLVIIFGSRAGIPLSTTQCKVGSTVAQGLVDGAGAVNWKLLIRIVVGWVATVVVAAIVAGVITLFAVNAPHG